MIKNVRLRDKEKIFDYMSKYYLYIYYCDLETEIYYEIYNASEHVHTILGETGNVSMAVNDLSRMLLKPEYVTEMAEFVDLSTLAQRLQGKKCITQQVEGNFTSWLEAVIFSGEQGEDGSLKSVIFAVRDISYEKEKENKLIYNSYVDDMTQLYNRKMYNENLAEYNGGPMQKNLALLSVDVNGLKVVNDTLGHSAGDELLSGVADCLRNCFRQYGRIYRLGGDEYAAIIYISPGNLPKLIDQFDEMVNNWHGKLVDKMSISLGYVTRAEGMDKSIYDMAKIADARMYKAKESYYAQKGVDRNGRQVAHAALCAIYIKVLKINLTDNCYQIIQIDEEEFSQVNSLRCTLSEDLVKYAEIGNIVAEDKEKYYNFFDIEQLKKVFDAGSTHLSITYRRKISGEFRKVQLELARAQEYSPDNRIVFLFVRCID